MDSPKNGKPKGQATKPAATSSAKPVFPPPGGKPAPAAVPQPVVKIPPMFRKIDWITMLIAFGVVWVVYFLTLAPQVTLEDSGELCTGAFYAGIPHPPGYPFWSLYSWIWTSLLRVGNVAWRVEVGESTGAAFACGLVGLMVSRGSSMLMEGISDLKTMTGKWENAICIVCGSVAGILLGLGGVMWSESVAINRISLFGVPWVMLVMVLILRWIYAPNQLRYLLIAMFVFGICSTIHQTLLCAAMGIEAAIVATRPKLGREFLLWNSCIFLAGLFAVWAKLTNAFDVAEELRLIFLVVGLLSIIGYGVFAFLTKESSLEFCRDACLAAFFVLSAMAVKYGPFCLFLALLAVAGFIYLAALTWKIGKEWLVVLGCGLLVVMGMAFYIWEPISGMSTPPMQWGYPRTMEGFLHALSRGQYDKAHPTDVLHDPKRFIMQLGLLLDGVTDEYNWVLLVVALVPLLFFVRMQKRERSWLIGLTSVYLCIGVLLVILMNPSDDKQSVDLHKVFFTSSHAVIAVMLGYGLALIAAYMATHYQEFRTWGFLGGALAAMVGLFSLWHGTAEYYLGPTGRITSFSTLFHWIGWAFAPNHGRLPVIADMVVVAIPCCFLVGLWLYRNRAPLGLTLGLFALLPLYSGMSHWGHSEQRNHWYGYWFGHDMFTPPFVAPDGKLSYDPKLREQALKGPNAKEVYPEMTPGTILYGGTDPGRFCPTYMIFCESFIPHKDQPKQDQNFDRRDVYIITQNALADDTYMEYIRSQYNRSTQIDPPFFSEWLRSEEERRLNDSTNWKAQLVYKILDTPLMKIGKRIEDKRRAEGIYPPKEIYIPNGDDMKRAFNDYSMDVQQRYKHDTDPRLKDEPRQLKQGETPIVTPDGRFSVQGQTSVMAINGLLTKDIFDHNPTNDFYVEESFPLDWMFPYLEPYSDIMHINRTPLTELTDEVVKRDHVFWSACSTRMTGDWITYNTTTKELTEFVDRVYFQHDFNGFTGDARFIRDEQAQRSFSKLRTAIAGVYAWRLGWLSQTPTPPQYVAKPGAERDRMIREAEFAYRQAFVYCPFSPEVVFRYVQFLADLGRFADAYEIAKTCQKLDPNNGGVTALVEQLRPMANSLNELEGKVAANPKDYASVIALAAAYYQSQQGPKAVVLLDKMVADPSVDLNFVSQVVQVYEAVHDYVHLEPAMRRLVEQGTNPKDKGYLDLARLQMVLQKQPEALDSINRAFQLTTNADSLRSNALGEPLFAGLKTNAEFQRLTASQPEAEKK